MNAWQLAVLFGVVVATSAYCALRVVIKYDRQYDLGDVAKRRSTFFAVGLGLLVFVVTFLVAAK